MELFSFAFYLPARKQMEGKWLELCFGGPLGAVQMAKPKQQWERG
jgi:hypothetical protein